MARWEHFSHDADIGVRGYGDKMNEAFEQAALALTAVVTNPACVMPQDAIEIRCEAPDDELLLADWLNQVIYEMASRGMLFSRFEVSVDDHRVVATAWGEVADVERHHPVVEIKGATYTALRVAQENHEWLAQTVVDV